MDKPAFSGAKPGDLKKQAYITVYRVLVNWLLLPVQRSAFLKKRTMKKIFLLFCCCYSLLPCTAQPESRSADITVTVQEGIELLSTIQYLGCQLANSTPSSYKQEIKTYFLPYRSHPAVTTIFMMSPTIYPDLTELGLLFYDFPAIKMRPMPDSSSWYKSIPRKELEEYLRFCMKFYRDSRFHTFYSAHQQEYAGWGGQLKKSMEEPAGIFARHFSGDAPLHWLVCLDPLNDWGAHTIVPRKLSAELKNHIVYQLGYFGDKTPEGGMRFKMNVYDFTWHESAHAISDGILAQYRTEIDSLSWMMKNDPALKKQNITDWAHYFDELIARSISIALHKQYRSATDHEKLLQFETGRGFIYAADVSDIIYDNLIHEQKISSFRELLPLLFTTLKSRYKKEQ